MQGWQVIASVLSVLVPILLFLWHIYSKLDGKIDSSATSQSNKIDSLAESHHSLAREFSELRGEIRTRFGILDQERVNKALEEIHRAGKGGV